MGQRRRREFDLHWHSHRPKRRTQSTSPLSAAFRTSPRLVVVVVAIDQFPLRGEMSRSVLCFSWSRRAASPLSVSRPRPQTWPKRVFPGSIASSCTSTEYKQHLQVKSYDDPFRVPDDEHITVKRDGRHTTIGRLDASERRE